MLKMVDGTGIIGVDMICPLGVSTPQPPNYDRVEMEGTGMLVLPNSLDAPLERLELGGKTTQKSTRGVNLFDVSKVVSNSNVIRNGDGSIKVIATESNNGFAANTPNTLKDYCPLLIVGQTYTLSANTAATTKQIYLKESGAVWTYGESVQITKEMLDSVVLFYSDVNKTSVISNIQIERGSTATAYEPYSSGKASPSPEYEQDIESAGKLNTDTRKYEIVIQVKGADTELQSLTLTSDRPLTKWDRLVEQGGEIGWLYQSKIVYLTGEEEWISNLNAFYTTTYNFIKNNAAKCSHYVLGGITNQEKNNIFSIGDGAYTNSLWIRDTRFSTARDFKAHLSDLAKKGTPIMVVSPVASTEFIPLPQSEQTAIRALKTYYPTTVITADGGELDPDIKVTYRKEK